MSKEEHLQEFIKLLKEEMEKDRPPRNPRFDDMVTRHGVPPSIALQRIAHFNRHLDIEETWLGMAVTAFEQWERETYPDEVPLP